MYMIIITKYKEINVCKTCSRMGFIFLIECTGVVIFVSNITRKDNFPIGCQIKIVPVDLTEGFISKH